LDSCRMEALFGIVVASNGRDMARDLWVSSLNMAQWFDEGNNF
jgi:hypothetical protein